MEDEKWQRNGNHRDLERDKPGCSAPPAKRFRNNAMTAQVVACRLMAHTRKIYQRRALFMMASLSDTNQGQIEETPKMHITYNRYTHPSNSTNKYQRPISSSLHIYRFEGAY
jgi:hypothetical protein